MVGATEVAPSALNPDQRKAGYIADPRMSETVNGLLKAKFDAGVTFDDIAAQLGMTNVYVAQLFHQQAQLKPDTAKKLKAAVPTLTDDQLALMQKAPFRVFDSEIAKEPCIYRLTEAALHYGNSIKEIINEKFGDGIMSAIDFYVNVEKVKGQHGEDRVLLTFNGKYLPYNEQTANY